jgi:hypothetical protein
MDPRAVLDAVEKTQVLPQQGVGPRPFSPYPVAMPTVKTRVESSEMYLILHSVQHNMSVGIMKTANNVPFLALCENNMLF